MAATITHTTQSAVQDLGEEGLIGPTEWNENHTLAGTIPVANGGTDATTAADARTNLGVAEELTDLTDVDLTGEAHGDILRNASGVWGPDTLELSDLENADTTGEAHGDFLVNQSGVYVPVTVDANYFGLGTDDTPQFTGIEVGHASDTTLDRASAGDLNVEGNLIYRAGGTDVPVADGGTGRSSHTAYAVLCGGTTSTAAQQSIADVGTSGQVLTSNGAGALPTFQTSAASAANFVGIVNGRLTLESGVAVSVTSQTAKTTLYFTPYGGNRIALYDGANWQVLSFSETSLSLSGLAANTNFDVFGYELSGVLTLEEEAWSSDTARNVALTTQDGVYVKTSEPNKRYLGTFRTTGTIGQCEFSFGGTAAGGTAANQFVWNAYNRVESHALVQNSTSSWTYNSATWRVPNAATGQRVHFVRGLNEDSVHAVYGVPMTGGASGDAQISIGLDGTSPVGQTVYFSLGTNSGTANANHVLKPGLGYHYLQPLERQVTTASTATFFGVLGSVQCQGFVVSLKN